MAEISKFFVNIGSKFDSAGIKKGLTGMNKFKAAAAKVTKALKVVAVAGAAIGVALFAAGLKVAKIAGIQEKAEVALAQAMKTAGTFTQEALEHNLEYAASLQKITAFGDETILSVQKLLTNYGAQGKELDDLTKSTLDFAVATGMSLEGAAALVGKTIGSTTNALTRYGITVEGAVGSTDRMQSAVKGISKLFAGAAQAEARTYDGMVKQLSNRFGDLMEKIGFKVIPIFQEMIKVINEEILPVFENFLDSMGDSETAAEKFGKSLKTIVKNTLAAATFLDALADGVAAFIIDLVHGRGMAEEAYKSMGEKFLKYQELIEKHTEEGVGRTRETEKEKTEITEEEIMKRIQAEQNRQLEFTKGLKKGVDEVRAAMTARWAAVQGYVSQVSATFESFFNLQSVQIQNEMNEDIDAAQKRHDAKLTNEEEYRAEVENIRDAAARKEKKAREALKPVMIAQAIANTALGVTKSLPNLILAGLVAAAGAAEVATISAQKFGKGVRNFAGGLGIVGDEGPELMEIPRGANIYNNAETKNMIGGRTTVNNYISLPPIPNRAYARLMAGEVKKELAKPILLNRRIS